MTTTCIHLIRHGVTASNVQRVYMGRSDESISTEGRWQARQLARRLQRLDLEAIYSSPLRRALETAEIVARPHRHPVRVDADIVEIDLSRWQGRPFEEIATADPVAWETWCRDPSRLALPGIETFESLAERVRRFLNRLRKDHYAGGAVAVVSHDGVIRMAVMEALALSWSHYRSLPLDNTSITTVEVGGPHPHLRRFNDVGHLNEAGVSGTAGN
jgi:broad specificity phosphatase PhoE